MRPHTRSTPAYWSKRLFRNCYTYQGRQCRVAGWSVKIQHAGQRRTLSLSARSRKEAAREALLLFQTIITQGWPAARAAKSGHTEPSPRATAYWRPRLVRRQYIQWARESSKHEWSICVERDARRHYFALDTNSPARAAEKAARIYSTVEKAGWAAACQKFEREITVAIFWSFDPLAYTYTTLLSRIEEIPAAADLSTRPIWIIEPDREVRATLQFWISRQTPLHPVLAFGSWKEASSQSRSGGSSPDLILINRLGQGHAAAGAAELLKLAPSLPIYNYGLFEDSNQLFLSFSAVHAGYVLRRTRPECLLAPYAFKARTEHSASPPLQERIKHYFQSFFERPPSATSLPAFALLTEREKQILDALAKGCVDKEIADSLRISAWTVHSHLRNIFEKLHVRTRTEAVVKYLQK